ncbi:MAG: SDR family oxidoreductase [Pseudomonadota bacterium]
MAEKRALVTGGGRRLGFAMAKYLAGRGHDVAVHYNSSSAGADQVVEEITAMGRRAVALQGDLLDEGAVAGLIPRAAEGLGGPLNVLVNNASLFERDTVRAHTRESWDRNVGSNLRVPVHLTQVFANQAPMAPMDHWGEPVPQALVVNMLDQRVLSPSPEYMSYTVAKMGLWAFTRTAAMALAPDIRVNGIGPGWTLPDPGQSHEDFLAGRKAVAVGRPPHPEDICAALGYFLDAPSVTGQMLAVDGAQHLDWQSRTL